jgi:hypothetical protein
MKSILIVLVIVAACVGGYIYFSQPEEIPNIRLKASDGRPRARPDFAVARF